MAWTTINQTYATPQHKNAWAHLASVNAWRRVNPDQPDGVTNVLVLLALAKATNKQAFVSTDAANNIVNVYF
ncbi:MAG TPA: hypothetical protein VHF25_05585 [Nitriliruptorales bacterium]|nr:hypothetical protein [Nitriliruptorales bacterium]